MITLTPKQINEIARQIQGGFICYIHIKTGELIFMPNMESQLYADEELFAEEQEKVRPLPSTMVRL
jgi:hypothetical protein